MRVLFWKLIAPSQSLRYASVFAWNFAKEFLRSLLLFSLVVCAIVLVGHQGDKTPSFISLFPYILFFSLIVGVILASYCAGLSCSASFLAKCIKELQVDFLNDRLTENEYRYFYSFFHREYSSLQASEKESERLRQDKKKKSRALAESERRKKYAILESIDKDLDR